MAQDSEDWKLLASLEPEFSEVDELANDIALAKLVLSCEYRGKDPAEVAELKSQATLLLQSCNKALSDLDTLDELKSESRKFRQNADLAWGEVARVDAERKTIFKSLKPLEKCLWVGFLVLNFLSFGALLKSRWGKSLIRKA